MKKIKSVFVAIVVLTIGVGMLTGCKPTPDSSNTAVCSNGQFVGAAEKERLSAADKASVDKYMESKSDLDKVWARSALITEALFREPSIHTAEVYADAAGEGKTYMYYFAKRSDNFDFIGACHASELAYVFKNINETDFSGTVDEDLAGRMCRAWANFARTGNPSTDGAEWTEYDSTNRNTMVIGNDCSMKMVSDPLGEDRKLTRCLTNYYFWSAGA